MRQKANVKKPTLTKLGSCAGEKNTTGETHTGEGHQWYGLLDVTGKGLTVMMSMMIKMTLFHSAYEVDDIDVDDDE